MGGFTHDTSSETSKSPISAQSAVGGIKSKAQSVSKIENPSVAGIKSRSQPALRPHPTPKPTPSALPKVLPLTNQKEGEPPSRSELLAQQASQEATLRAANELKKKERDLRRKEKKKSADAESSLKRDTSTQESAKKKHRTQPSQDKPDSDHKSSSNKDKDTRSRELVKPSQRSSQLRKRRISSASASGDQLDPTLDSNGRKARRPISPPSAQTLDIHDDEDYPAVAPKRAKIRSSERAILSLIKGREDFGKFPEDDIINTAENLFECGISSIDELERSRPVNRTFILEDLRDRHFHLVI